MPYVEERAERMRRLRFAVQVFTDAHIPLGPDGVSERRRRSDLMTQDPDLFMLVAAMTCGPELAPSPALRTRSGRGCSPRFRPPPCLTRGCLHTPGRGAPNEAGTTGLPQLLSWGANKPASELGRKEDLLKNWQCLNDRFLQPLTFSFGHSEVLGASIDANLQAQVDEGPVVSKLVGEHRFGVAGRSGSPDRFEVRQCQQEGAAVVVTRRRRIARHGRHKPLRVDHVEIVR